MVSGALKDWPAVGPLALCKRACACSVPLAYRVSNTSSPAKLRYSLNKSGTGAMGLSTSALM
eukprot:2725236-Prorocentrum_lima.AAC.1